jgi:hypothetical protein
MFMKTFMKIINSTLWTILCLFMAGVGFYGTLEWMRDIEGHWSWLDDSVEIDHDEDGDA